MGASQVRTGKSAERRIASTLSSILGLNFVRTVGSGSGHTWRYFEGEKVRGDVICLNKDHDFPFLIESKKSGNFKFDLLLREQTQPDFDKWWEKTCADAMLDDKSPMLVIARFQGPMIVFVKRHDLITKKIIEHQEIPFMEYCSPNGEIFIVCTLETFAHTYKGYRDGDNN